MYLKKKRRPRSSRPAVQTQGRVALRGRRWGADPMRDLDRGPLRGVRPQCLEGQRSVICSGCVVDASPLPPGGCREEAGEKVSNLPINHDTFMPQRNPLIVSRPRPCAARPSPYLGGKRG